MSKILLFIFLGFTALSCILGGIELLFRPGDANTGVMSIGIGIIMVFIIKKVIKKSPNKKNLKMDQGVVPSDKIRSQSDNLPISIFAQNIPRDVVDLLWFSDGKYKNYDPASAGKRFNADDGISFTYTLSGDIEPSSISLQLPVKKPKNLLFVEALSYYPTYSAMNPEQRWVYINWLTNIDNEIDIGYVFTLYYGLERHLFSDNFEASFIMILRLRNIHKNNSFLSYSGNALIASLLFHKRVDLFEKLTKISQDIPVSTLYIYVKYILGLSLEVTEVIALSSEVDFTNKRYIKSDFVLFTEILEKELHNKFGGALVPLKNININQCQRSRSFIVANTSLSPREISIPNIMTYKPLKQELLECLKNTHENVKNVLKEHRKKD